MVGFIIFVVLLILMFIGVPIGFAMGISATFMLLFTGTASPVSIATKAVNGLDSFTIMAIPFFMLGSSIMSGTNVGRYIFDFCGTMVRHIRGGYAHMNILLSMIMAGMSGSSVADVVGTGKMEIDAMTHHGYDRDFSAAVTATSSCIAPIIPPSTSAILYGSITGVSIGGLLIAGILPGILMAICMMILCYFIAKKRDYPLQPKATWGERWSTFKHSFAALMFPVILVGGIMSGWFTATEAACVAVLYACFIGFFVYRELSFKKLFEILETTSEFAASTLFILSMAAIFGLILTHNRVPQLMCDFFLSLSDNKYVILFLINVVLIILGMLMEGNAIYMIMGPILAVLAVELGCHPVHFGAMVIFNLTLGLITPPVGLCLFLTQKVSGITSKQMIKAILPFIVIMFVALFIITYVPFFTTFLPRVTMGL